MLVTSRPHTLVALDAWKPTWIQPDEERNLQDMRLLVRKRLEKGQHVLDQDIGEAVEMVLHKSQVGEGCMFCFLCWSL